MITLEIINTFKLRQFDHHLAADIIKWFFMMTSSNGNIFRVTGHLCGEFTSSRWISAQSPVTRSFDVSFDLCLNKRLGKQSWGWWFKTQSRPLWRQCNVLVKIVVFSLHFTEICFCLSTWHMFSLAPIMNWHRTGDTEPQRMMKPISKAIVHHPHYVAAYFLAKNARVL